MCRGNRRELPYKNDVFPFMAVNYRCDGKTQYLPIQLSRKNAMTLTKQNLKSVVVKKNTTFLANSTCHLAVLLIWSPSWVSLSLSHTHIGLP